MAAPSPGACEGPALGVEQRSSRLKPRPTAARMAPQPSSMRSERRPTPGLGWRAPEEDETEEQVTPSRTGLHTPRSELPVPWPSEEAVAMVVELSRWNGMQR